MSESKLDPKPSRKPDNKPDNKPLPNPRPRRPHYTEPHQFPRLESLDLRPRTFKEAVAVSVGVSLVSSIYNISSGYYARRANQREDERYQAQVREYHRREERRRALLEELGVDIDEPNISQEVITAARDELGCDPEKLNIVFAGNVNVGKSSLLNAIRDKSIHDDDFAPVGASQVTLDRVRYQHPVHENIVLFDTPGAGTQDVQAFRYYYDQKLYAFDIVIIVHDTTLTQSDIRLLQVCNGFGQECILVRTKCDMHIRNYERDRDCSIEEARQLYISEARLDVLHCQEQLTSAWPDFAVIIEDNIISAPAIRRAVRGQPQSDAVDVGFTDEMTLLTQLRMQPNETV